MAGIAGLVDAIERFSTTPVFERPTLQPLIERLAMLTDIDEVNLAGPLAKRLANTISFTVAGTDSMTLLAALDLEGICASSGSACSAGSLNPSHVLSAMGRNDDANSLVRFSLGRESSIEDIDHVLDQFPKVLGRIRSS